MHLTRLALTDFRSYPSTDVALGPGVTIFSGPNGEGKTNLVEAVGYVATLASHRVAHDAPLTRPRDILGVLRTVVFAPEDLALVKGDPGERRRFLDDLLVAMAPRYAAVREPRAGTCRWRRGSACRP